MSMKRMLKEKDAKAQRTLGEILSEIPNIPDSLVDEVVQFIKGKLEIYEREIKSRNGNGTIKG